MSPLPYTSSTKLSPLRWSANAGTVESAIQIAERYEAILDEYTDKKRNNVQALNSISDSGPSNTRTHQYHNNRFKPNDKL